MDNKYCNNCGNKLEDGTRFCTRCGKEIDVVVPIEVVKSSENRPKEETKSFHLGSNEPLEGLSGWLIIVCIGMLYNLYNSLSTVYADVKLFIDGTVESLSIIKGYSILMCFELLAFTAISLLIIYLLFLFFKKSKNFPKIYFIYILTIVVVSLLDILSLSLINYPTDEIRVAIQNIISESYAGFAKTLVYSIIWGLYIKKSERVKITFVK